MDTMTTESHAATEETSSTAPTRRGGRTWILFLVVVAAATVGWWYLSQEAEAPVEPEAEVELSFAEVVRRDLVEVETYDGTLGRSDGDAILNRAPGTLTAAVAPGATVTAGQELYRVDDYPVVLLPGDLPAWRQLEEGVDEGPDVEQLERALADLGYDPDETVTIDEEFTTLTEDMVQRWQEDLGVEDDGVVELGEVIFLPGDVRIADVTAAVGSPLQSGSQLLMTSSVDIVVLIDLPTADQGVLEEGDSVIVVLPDNTETSGTVTSVGTIATTDAQGSATVEVEVSLDDPSVAGNLDEAPVEIEVVADSVENVLAVPVTALVALSEGGYAVQVADDDVTLSYIAVDPGFFADGFVEIDADGLQPGDRVVVP